MGMTINLLLDLTNSMCKIAFISYAWITMRRINTYIKEHEKNGNDDRRD